MSPSKILQELEELATTISASDLMNGERLYFCKRDINQFLDLRTGGKDTTFDEIAVLDGTFCRRDFKIGSKKRKAATISVGRAVRTEAIETLKI